MIVKIAYEICVQIHETGLRNFYTVSVAPSIYMIIWRDRYFASRAKIHGTQCCGANPPKLEMIRSLAPHFELT
jgi:hypothetical protein